NGRSESRARERDRIGEGLDEIAAVAIEHVGGTRMGRSATTHGTGDDDVVACCREGRAEEITARLERVPECAQRLVGRWGIQICGAGVLGDLVVVVAGGTDERQVMA